MRPRLAAAAVAVAVLALAGCGGDDSDDADATDETTTTTVDETTTSSTGADGSDTTIPVAFPPANTDLSHGGTTWAVVLVGAATHDDPAVLEAERLATDAGFNTGPTDCDMGAPEALGLPDSAFTVSVYFATEADAVTALDAFQRSGLDGGAVAEVQTFCMD